jgi:hypothetical protein
VRSPLHWRIDGPDLSHHFHAAVVITVLNAYSGFALVAEGNSIPPSDEQQTHLTMPGRLHA